MHPLISLQLVLAQATPATPANVTDTSWMVWAIIAFGVAVTLLVLEAFLPSGGVLGILAGICALAGIVMFFQFDTMWGMVSILVSLAAAPFLVAGMLWIWPKTPIGMALTLQEEQQPVNQGGQADADDKEITTGMEGKTLTELRPVGACRLNGQRVDCISQSGVIGKNTPVRVISVEGSSIKVKAS